MKIRAKQNFAGILTMYNGQVLECHDQAVLDDLLSCGYVEAVEQTEPAKGSGDDSENKRNTAKKLS